MKLSDAPENFSVTGDRSRDPPTSLNHYATPGTSYYVGFRWMYVPCVLCSMRPYVMSVMLQTVMTYGRILHKHTTNVHQRNST
jgi:hypothetical protein